MLVLISVKTGLYLGTWVNVVIGQSTFQGRVLFYVFQSTGPYVFCQYEESLGTGTRQLQTFINDIFTIISKRLWNPHSSEYTQKTCSQTEGLAKVFVTRWMATALRTRGI